LFVFILFPAFKGIILPLILLTANFKYFDGTEFEYFDVNYLLYFFHLQDLHNKAKDGLTEYKTAQVHHQQTHRRTEASTFRYVLTHKHLTNCMMERPTTTNLHVIMVII
jgi:hypothetical protein